MLAVRSANGISVASPGRKPWQRAKAPAWDVFETCRLGFRAATPPRHPRSASDVILRRKESRIADCRVPQYFGRLYRRLKSMTRTGLERSRLRRLTARSRSCRAMTQDERRDDAIQRGVLDGRGIRTSTARLSR